jgi:hypothetical protein
MNPRKRRLDVYGLTRGTTTLIGVAVAGFLLWLATQFQAEGNADYWTQMGLVAGAGLVMALSQLLGGWTKWGWPRLSPTVFLLGFLPALVAGGLVLLDAQPDSGAWGASWAADLGLNGLAEDLSAVLPAIAFAIGLVFGFTFDTTGPVVDDDVDVVEERRTAEPVPVDRRATEERELVPLDRRATEEPVTAERRARYDDETGADVDGDGRREVVRSDDDGDGRREVVRTGHDGSDRRRGFFRR